MSSLRGGFTVNANELHDELVDALDRLGDIVDNINLLGDAAERLPPIDRPSVDGAIERLRVGAYYY